MPSTYLPLQLVHAHLPAPPSVPNAIPETRVPSDRPFPTTVEVLNEPNHPDHAISTAYDRTSGIFARSIQNGYALELRNSSLEINSDRKKSSVGSETVRIAFPDQLRPLVDEGIVLSVGARKLFVLVLSTSNVLYRLSFPVNNFRAGVGDRFRFIKQDSEDWCEEWEVPEDVVAGCGDVGAWTVWDENNVFLGCGDGGLVRLSRSSKGGNGLWSAHHHRATSRLRLPFSFGRSASDEQVIAFAQYQSETNLPLIYTLSRDCKLRTWNAHSGSLLRTLDIRLPSLSSETPLLREASAVPLVQVVQHPSRFSRFSHLLVVYIDTPSASTSQTFVVYRASSSATGAGDLTLAGDRPCPRRLQSADLRGFDVIPPSPQDIETGWRLLTVWDDKGSTILETVFLDDIFQFMTYLEPTSGHSMLLDWQAASLSSEGELFDATYFDSLISRTPLDPAQQLENSDISETFIEHLTRPGAFSNLTIATALDEYCNSQLPKRQPPLTQLAAPYPTLSKRLAGVVGCHLEMMNNPQTGAPLVEIYREKLKLDWLGIWARIRALDKQSRWPVGLMLLDGGQAMVATRDGSTAIVAEDFMTMLQRVASCEASAEDFLDLPERSLKNAFPTLSPPLARRAAVRIAAAGSMLSSWLEQEMVDPDIGSALPHLKNQIDTLLEENLQLPIELVGGLLCNSVIDQELLTEHRVIVRKQLSECTDRDRGMNDLLDQLASFDRPLTDVDVLRLSASGLGNALATSALSKLIMSRYDMACNILLVALFILSESDESLGDDDESEELHNLLARAFLAYHRYNILRWVSQQTGEEAVDRSKAKRHGKRNRNGADDPLSEGLGGLQVRDADDDNHLDSDSYEVAYSLLHSLLARRVLTVLPSRTLTALPTIATDFLNATNILPRSGKEFALQSSDLEMANMILTSGYPRHAGQFVEFYPYSAGTAYISGRSYLEDGDIEQSVRSLHAAAAGSKNGSFTSILPATAGPQGLTEYYRHIARLFEDHGDDGPVVYFGMLAIRSIGASDPLVKGTWTKTFLANIGLGAYEEAYSVLTSCPHHDLKREFLSQLIAVMCEANEVGRLNSLGFVGFQGQVEEILRFKAYHSDPLRFPNYYNVLYSWHISRGDYRTGEIMYAQGQRFIQGANSRVSAAELSTMQARSYLAAINALSLVDKRNAWVPVAAHTEKSQRGVKRRKTTSYIPQEEFTRDNQAITIVSLEDIEAEYTLVLSRLQLSAHIRDLQEHGVSIDAETVVGFFVQRNMFDMAQSAGVAMGVDMIGLFRTLAELCIELARQSNLKPDQSSATFLHTSPLTSRLRGAPLALALRYLELSLSRHDSKKTQFRYREAVAEAFFRLNQDKRSGWQMPVWLVHWELDRDSEGWISRALRWGWVSEAVDWTAEILRRATPPELLPPSRPDAAYTPYALIDRVLAAANEEEEKADEALQRKVNALRDEVGRRIAGLRKVKKP